MSEQRREVVERGEPPLARPVSGILERIGDAKEEIGDRDLPPRRFGQEGDRKRKRPARLLQEIVEISHLSFASCDRSKTHGPTSERRRSIVSARLAEARDVLRARRMSPAMEPGCRSARKATRVRFVEPEESRLVERSAGNSSSTRSATLRSARNLTWALPATSAHPKDS